MLPLPDDLYYMPYGRPAVASVTFLNPAITGNTLTINGVVYTFGTDWGSRFSGTFTPNYVPGSSVRDLAELINGVDDQGRGSLALLPNATVFARAAGSKLLLFAREPGTAGNSYTLSTNNSAAFIVSGATFSGGTSTSSGATTIADGADVAEGNTTDAPVADNTTVTSATPATIIGLLKRLVNLAIANLAKLPLFGIAGAASANVITVQGIASGTTLPVTASLAAAQTLATVTTVAAVTAITNALPAGTNTIGTVSLTDISAGEYETVAASASAQILGATGGVGDFLGVLLIVPATTSPGAVSITDGNGSAITVFAGGASSVSNLCPFPIPLGIKCVNATTPGWKVTTGTNVSCIGCGNFS